MKVEPTRRSWIASEILTIALSFMIAQTVPASAWAQESSAVPSEEDTDSAVGCMRTINTAEVTYASTYNKGFSPTLKSLGEPPKGVKPSASAADFVDESLAGGKKSNYVFNYKAGKPDKDGTIGTYAVTARPVKWSKGIKSFFSDESGVIRWTDENRAPKAATRRRDSLESQESQPRVADPPFQ